MPLFSMLTGTGPTQGYIFFNDPNPSLYVIPILVLSAEASEAVFG